MLAGFATPAPLMLAAAPVGAALVAAALGRRAPVLVARLGAWTAGAGFLVAAAIAAVSPDRLGAALLLLVFGVSAIAQAFAVRYLAGEPQAAWFTCGASLLTAASAVMVTATTLVGLALGWTAAGIALCLLLGTYRQLPAARDGVRRTAIAFVIGDAALWAAVGLIAGTSGDLRLGALDAGPLTAVVAVLVVIAALSRSAQIPFHRWLPATLAAPTPVSALLHAGVVNAGGVLLVRASPLSGTALAAGIVVAAGALSMAHGTLIMLVKPDIKGALAYSTMAQMGFMMLTCGLGLWAAAVIHLIGHGFYKATLFLSSGSAIARRRRHRALPQSPRPTRRRRLAALTTAVLLPPTALGAAALLVLVHHPGEVALLLFAWVTGAAATWGWLQRQPTVAGAVSAAAVLAPAALGYVAVVSALSTFLTPSLPATTMPAPAVWAVAAASLVGLGVLAAVRKTPALQHAAYTHALRAGTLQPHATGASR